MKALVGAFNQEKALVGSRGLLRDCTNGCGTDGELHSSNQDQYVNADKARYNSEKVSTLNTATLTGGHLSSAGQEPGIPPHQRHPEQNITVSPDHSRGRTSH